MRDEAPAAPMRVLLATDLAPVSEAATEEALRLAEREGAALVVLSVIDPGSLRLPGGGYWRRMDQVRETRAAGAERVARRARERGVSAHYLVWDGDPADAIVAAAQAEQADLIVMGSHGRGALGRLQLGSVSSRVAAAAGAQVLIIGPDGTGRSAPRGPDGSGPMARQIERTDP